MLGLTFDKLVMIAILAAFLIGPERLPAAAAWIGRAIRGLRVLGDGAKSRIREEMGEEFDQIDWKKLDPRAYDPRRIVREALQDPVVDSVKRPDADGPN